MGRLPVPCDHDIVPSHNLCEPHLNERRRCHGPLYCQQLLPLLFLPEWDTVVFRLGRLFWLVLGCFSSL